MYSCCWFDTMLSVVCNERGGDMRRMGCTANVAIMDANDTHQKQHTSLQQYCLHPSYSPQHRPCTDPRAYLYHPPRPPSYVSSQNNSATAVVAVVDTMSHCEFQFPIPPYPVSDLALYYHHPLIGTMTLVSSYGQDTSQWPR